MKRATFCWISSVFVINIIQSTTDVYGCVDLALNCRQLQAQYFCTNQIYLQVMSENCKYTCGYCNPSSIFQPYPQPPQQNTGGLFPPNTLNPYPLPAQQNPNGIYPPNTLNPNPYPNPYPYNPPYNPYNPQPSYQAPVTNCVDKSNNCLSWNRNGFCQSSFYDPTVKQDYCAATCGLCGTSAFSSG